MTGKERKQVGFSVTLDRLWLCMTIYMQLHLINIWESPGAQLAVDPGERCTMQ